MGRGCGAKSKMSARSRHHNSSFLIPHSTFIDQPAHELPAGASPQKNSAPKGGGLSRNESGETRWRGMTAGLTGTSPAAWPTMRNDP